MQGAMETIIIQKPSPALLEMISKMREHKARLREEMRNVDPMFVINA